MMSCRSNTLKIIPHLAKFTEFVRYQFISERGYSEAEYYDRFCHKIDRAWLADCELSEDEIYGILQNVAKYELELENSEKIHELVEVCS